SDSVTTPQNLELVCSEVDDRTARKANVILRNVPESKSTIIEEKKISHDLNNLSSLPHLDSIPSTSFFLCW
ncbi:hypothetical protein J6590_051212, partial [Homalodisca vitripennis]